MVCSGRPLLSLEWLILLVLQLIGPMLVALLAMALLLPLWLKHAEQRGGRAWREACRSRPWWEACCRCSV